MPFWHPKRGRTACCCCPELARLVWVSKVSSQIGLIMLTDVGVDFIRGCLILESDLQSRHSACSSDRRILVYNRLLSDNRLRLLRCSYFSRNSRCSSWLLRSGGFFVARNRYAFDQLLEPRHQWIGSCHDETVLTFLLVVLGVWKGR